MNTIQVVAFVLEAFFAELDIESSENGEEQDQVSIFWSLSFKVIVSNAYKKDPPIHHSPSQ